MNPNRFVAILSLSLSFAAGAWAQPASPVDQLYAARQYELADAYWAAGQKFIDLGQADRGAEFQAKAKRIFPGYVPGQKQPVIPAAPAAPVPAVPAAEVVRERNLQGEKIARLQFQKLLRGYLTGSASTVEAALGPQLTVQGENAEAGTEAVNAFLQAHPAEAGSPGELFDLDSMQVSSAGTTVTLTVKPNSSAPGGLAGLLPFWKESQIYTFDRVGDTWKLTAVAGE